MALEYYCPRVMHAAIDGTTAPYRLELLAVFLLTSGWVTLATVLFRKRGWQ